MKDKKKSYAMKEIILKSKRFPSLYIQILNGSFAMMHDDAEENGFITDNPDYALAMYELFNEAVKRKALRPETNVSEENPDSEEFYI